MTQNQTFRNLYGDVTYEDLKVISVDNSMTEAQKYARRDASYMPNKTCANWLRELRNRLEGGAPWGKITSREEVAQKMRDWLEAIEHAVESGEDLTPEAVYSLAHEECLTFLGW